MQRGKRVVLLSAFDFTGSGYRICEAVGLHTNYFMQHIVMMPMSSFAQFKLTAPIIKNEEVEVEVGGKIEKQIRYKIYGSDIERLNKIIKDADIIHLKSDFLITEEMFKYLVIPDDTPIIQTVCGSGFRIGNTRAAKGKGNFEDYINTTSFRTALNPDLNYPAYDAVYTPFAYDCDLIKPTWKPATIPIISHSPSSRDKKGSDMFEQAMKELQVMGYDFKVDVIEGVSHQECLQRKSQATIFFDQNMIGSYGNSAVEAMAWGIPTVAYLSDMAIEQADGLLDNCPVINCGKTLERMIEAFEYLLDPETNLQQISKDTKEYVNNIHGYKAMAKQWVNIYEQVYRL